MFNMEYKKINLRDFRNNLTHLRDSGQAYTIFKKGVPFAYFIPSEYEVKVTKKKVTQEEFCEILDSIAANRTELKEKGDYKDVYRKLLEKKYLKDE